MTLRVYRSLALNFALPVFDGCRDHCAAVECFFFLAGSGGLEEVIEDEEGEEGRD